MGRQTSLKQEFEGNPTATTQNSKSKIRRTLTNNNTMGVASSSSSGNANEQALVRSLGDRYPLGDDELRKWCWCYIPLSRSSPPPLSCSSSLNSLSVWSTIYHKPGPEVSTFHALQERIEFSTKVSQAISVIEQHIFPPGLSSRIVNGLGITSSLSQPKSSQPQSSFPKSSSSNEEILAWEYSYYSIQSLTNEFATSGSVSYELQDFIEGISCSCGRRGSRSSLTKLFNLASSNDQGNKSVDASELIDIAYRLTVATSYLVRVAGTNNDEDWKSYYVPNDPNKIKSMVESLLNSAKKQRDREGSYGYSSYSYTMAATNSGSSVSIDEFIEWAEQTVPMMASSLSTFLHVLFNFFCQSNVGNHRFPPGVTPLMMPTITIDHTKGKPTTSESSPPSYFFAENTSFDLFSLACTSITLASGRFHRLFSSEADGLSCNRLMHALLGYGGPTLVVIRSKDISKKCASGLFGAFNGFPWDRESGDFYGNSDCFLFRLGPDPMGVYRPKGKGGENESNFMFFNPEARSKGYDQLAWGIGFGGTAQEPRLYIDEMLDGSTARDKDLTFQDGPLLSNNDESNSYCSFEVEGIEAFGVGSSQVIEDALNAREEHRIEAQKKIKNAMKGAKAAFLEDMQSGLVGGKVFKHREEVVGRDGGCDMDRSDESEK